MTWPVVLGNSVIVPCVRLFAFVATVAFTLLMPATGQSRIDFASLLQPVPESAKLIDPDYYIWGGTMIAGTDGKYHIFYSRWPRRLGHNAWVTNSEIAHAVGDTPEGPFRHAGVALPARGKHYWDGLCTHNPTALRIGKKIYLYYMGNIGDGKASRSLNWTHRNHQRIGVAVADDPNGPWQRFDKPVLDVSSDPDAPDSLLVSNPPVAQRPDGGYLMIYKAVGRKRPLPFGGPVVHLTATADGPTGPFTKQLRPIFTTPGVDFPAEDPFAWYDKAAHRYYAIVKDNQGYFTKAGKSLALWESADGFDWKLSPHPLVATTEVTWAGGRKQKLNSLERPQVFFANDGTPAVLLCAADEDPSRPYSYNLRIPLRAREWTILSLGDSITQGSHDFSNYRVPLAEHLAAAGFRVRFVGSRHTEGEPAALYHEGYGGKTTEFLAANIERLYRANPADIILLHAGHNHFDTEHPVPGIIGATNQIIETARRLNPHVIVLLAEVIPSGKLPKYSYIPELNQQLAALASRLNTPQQPVILVNQAAGFDYETDTIADRVHPNAAGAKKMADHWFDALAPILSAGHD